MALTYNFDDLTEETQRYLKKVMDIYAAIEGKKLVVNNQELSLIDKKVISLFIAGFLIDSNLKNIVSQYDIKIKDLLDFVQLYEDDIVPFDSYDMLSKRYKNYADYYNSVFKINLMNTISKGTNDYDAYFLSPELIFFCLRRDKYCGSDVISIFGEQNNIKNLNVSLSYNSHDIFNLLKISLIDCGCIAEKRNADFSSIFSYYLDLSKRLEKGKLDTDKNKDSESTEKEEEKTDKNKDSESTEKEEEKTDKNKDSEKAGHKFVIDENVWKLLEVIKTKFIGQEALAEDLFYNIINNQYLINKETINDGERSLIFLDGPSGTGKTAIIKEIAEKIGVPFLVTSMGEYSATGYVGGSLENILVELYNKANGDLELAQRGVVVLDEIDKLIFGGANALVMKKAVQHDLLKLLGGGKYVITVGDGLFSRRTIEFDTSKLTFAGIGALTDLRTKKTTVKSHMGFGESKVISMTQNYSITPADLIEIGFEKELIGRFNVFLHTEDYDVAALERILRESAISPVLGFKKWVEGNDKHLEITDDTYLAIAKCAHKLNTGARSLQTIMNNVRSRYIKEIMRGNSKTIFLDSETVYSVYNQTMNRKVRG